MFILFIEKKRNRKSRSILFSHRNFRLCLIVGIILRERGKNEAIYSLIGYIQYLNVVARQIGFHTYLMRIKADVI